MSSLHFPNYSIIVSYLEQHPYSRPSYAYLKDKGIIGAIARAFADQKIDQDGMRLHIMYKIYELELKEEAVTFTVENLSKALEDCANGKPIAFNTKTKETVLNSQDANQKAGLIKQPSNADLLAKQIGELTRGLNISWKPLSEQTCKSEKTYATMQIAEAVVTELCHKIQDPNYTIWAAKSSEGGFRVLVKVSEGKLAASGVQVVVSPSIAKLEEANRIAYKMNELTEKLELTNKIEWIAQSQVQCKSTFFNEEKDALKAAEEFKGKFKFPDINVLVNKTREPGVNKYRIILDLPKDFLQSLSLIEEKVNKAEKLFGADLSMEQSKKIKNIIHPNSNLNQSIIESLGVLERQQKVYGKYILETYVRLQGDFMPFLVKQLITIKQLGAILAVLEENN